MAAAFVADHFQKLGLQAINKGSYYQQFSLYSYKQGEISIATSSKKFSESTDVVFYGSKDTDGPKQYEVVFVGSGSDDDMSQVTIKDRVGLMMTPGAFVFKIGTHREEA